MSSRRGTFIECARCHSWIFMDDAKLSPDEQINFHQGKLPKDWTRVRGADLCPECSDSFELIFSKFIKNISINNHPTDCDIIRRAYQNKPSID